MTTIAAALVARGHALLADDVAAIRLDDSRALVYPGMPQFRLWPDAAAAVGARAEDLAELAPGYGKRVLASDARSSSRPARSRSGSPST